MDIITMRLDDLKPYSNNTKEHPQEQIDEIKESIARYGMNDPAPSLDNNLIRRANAASFAVDTGDATLQHGELDNGRQRRGKE